VRQKNAILVTIIVAVVLVVGLVVFSLARSGGDYGDRHTLQTEERQGGEPAGGEQAGGDSPPVGSDHDQHHHHASDDTPSGEMVDGVRVVKLTASTSKFDPARIVVQEGENVRLDVTGEDVTHRIGINAYGVDRKLDPGKTEAITFTADKPGRHVFHCSVCCGSGDNHMHGNLVVVELATPEADKDR